MLFLWLFIYFKKYFLKFIEGFNMECAGNNIIEKRKKILYIHWLVFIFYIIFSIVVIYFANNLLIEENSNKSIFALVSISLGFLSIGLAIFSSVTSFNSHSKMIQNANVNFLQAISDFENARIYFNRHIYNIEAYIWRSRTHLERAYELDKKLIKCKHHHRLIQYFITTISVLFSVTTWNNLTQGQQKSVKEMYRIAREYKRGSERQENNFSNVLGHLGKNTNETEIEFYNRMFN